MAASGDLRGAIKLHNSLPLVPSSCQILKTKKVQQINIVIMFRDNEMLTLSNAC